MTKPEAWMMDPYAPSRWKRWVWICVAVVMVYLLSVPPVTIVVTTGWPLSMAYAKRGARPEGWVKEYRVPYEWLAGKSFAKEVLRGYERWWWDVMVPMRRATGACGKNVGAAKWVMGLVGCSGFNAETQRRGGTSETED